MALMTDAKEMYIPDSRYRRLEYIHFSGAEYINTGLTVSGNTSYKKLDIKASFQNTTNWGINGFDSNTNNRFNIGVNGNGYTRIGVGSVATWADNDGVLLSLNTVYILSLLVNGTANSSVYDEQGSLIGTGATVSPSFSSDIGDLYIGAANSNNSAAGFCEEKIYNIKLSITNSNNIISNLIPAQRKSDNVCGLYDTITGTFKAMEGTVITDAAAGPIVEENMLVTVKKIEDANNIVLWEPLTLYEGYYLTSYSATKDTNYIDLGIKWNNTYKVEGYYYRPNIDSNYSRIFGTGWDTAREIQIDCPTSSGIGNLRTLIGNNYNITAYNTSSANTEYGFAVGNRGSQCEFWCNRSGNWSQASSTTWPNNLSISDYNIRLFSATQGDRDGIVGIKSIQINGPDDLWSQANALMYLVPAKKGDTYGLYDKNHSKFYPGIVANDGQFKITDVNGNQIA